MKKIYLFSVALLSFLVAKSALAVCPICTVAVVGGIELSRWLGVDDSITGLWIGGLTVSLIIWTIDWFNRKNIHFKGRKIITFLGYYILIVIPLYFINVISLPLINPLNFNSFMGSGIDKILVGILVGSIFFWLGAIYYEYLKKKNNGHAHFPFEKVVLPLAPLIILSFVFYFLTK